MQEEEYNRTQTEAVAVFHDAEALQGTIDELLTAGFDHAEISVLANEQTIKDKLGHDYKSTSELEDDPDVPRVEYVPEENFGNAQGGIIATAAYFPAVIGSLVVASSGGRCSGRSRLRRSREAPVRRWARRSLGSSAARTPST
jgi:hypothetical protein